MKLPVHNLTAVLGPAPLKRLDDVTTLLRDPAALRGRADLLVPSPAGETREIDMLRELQGMRTPSSLEFTGAIDKYGAGKHRGPTMDAPLSFHSDRPTVWESIADDIDSRVGPDPRLHGMTARELLDLAGEVSDSSWMTVKAAVNRTRPYYTEYGKSVQLAAEGIAPPNASWVSGHTAQGFTSRAVADFVDPSRAALHEEAAVQVGVARMMAGRHFPSDVLAGAYMGDGIASETIAAVAKLGPNSDQLAPALRNIEERWAAEMIEMYRAGRSGQVAA